MFKYVTGRTGSKYEQRELFFPLNSLTQFSKDLLRCYILDWDSSYICPGVRDGTHWSLEVTFDDGTIVESRGSNAFPPHWRKLLALFRKYGLPIFREVFKEGITCLGGEQIGSRMINAGYMNTNIKRRPPLEKTLWRRLHMFSTTKVPGVL